MSAGKTRFNDSVWKKISRIPRGKVSTYREIARALRNPKAARAVGNACNANPRAPAVPCHRVVASSGKISGFAFGVEKKIALLKKEGVRVKEGKIVDFGDKLFYFAKKAR